MPYPNQLILDFDCPTPDQASSDAGLLAPQIASQTAQKKPAGPIPFSIKVSARARQVYLRAVPGRGLVVTIPKRFPKREVPGIVESQRIWVEQALAELDAQVPERFRHWPPRSLPLLACDLIVAVEYLAPQGEFIQWRWQDESTLLIEADQSDKESVAWCVAAALKDRAKQVLGPWLTKLAVDHGFSYKRLVVRGQRSVWGSYSSSGTLSLNYKLLFLSPHLVDYVLLHELAHTKHLDHSSAFWNLLNQQMPGARGIDRQLHTAGNFVPPWLELAK